MSDFGKTSADKTLAMNDFSKFPFPCVRVGRTVRVYTPTGYYYPVLGEITVKNAGAALYRVPQWDAGKTYNLRWLTKEKTIDESLHIGRYFKSRTEGTQAGVFAYYLLLNYLMNSGEATKDRMFISVGRETRGKVKVTGEGVKFYADSANVKSFLRDCSVSGVDKLAARVREYLKFWDSVEDQFGPTLQEEVKSVKGIKDSASGVKSAEGSVKTSEVSVKAAEGGIKDNATHKEPRIVDVDETLPEAGSFSGYFRGLTHVANEYINGSKTPLKAKLAMVLSSTPFPYRMADLYTGLVVAVAFPTGETVQMQVGTEDTLESVLGKLAGSKPNKSGDVKKLLGKCPAPKEGVFENLAAILTEMSGTYVEYRNGKLSVGKHASHPTTVGISQFLTQVEEEFLVGGKKEKKVARAAKKYRKFYKKYSD